MLENIYKKIIFCVDDSNFLDENCLRLYKNIFSKNEISYISSNLNNELKESTLANEHDFIRNNDEINKQNYTEIFENLQTLEKSIASHLCFNLIKNYKRSMFFSMFSSVNGSIGLGRHIDVWDNCIIQLDGEKLWRFYQADQIIFETKICAGDVLLVPANICHDVVTIKKSKHLSIGLLKTNSERTIQ